jgi:hypothetical protein
MLILWRNNPIFNLITEHSFQILDLIEGTADATATRI